MAVGTGSLKRAASAGKKTEIFAVPDNNVVVIGTDSLDYERKAADKNLVKSVKVYGVILPIVVTGGEKFKVVDGAKRLNALAELGVKTVKAVVIDAEEKAVAAELKKYSEKAVDPREEKFRLIERLPTGDLPIYLL